MRKNIIYIILVVTFFTLCFSVNAAEYSDPRDSRYISPDVLEELNDAGTEVIVKGYNSCPLTDFSDYDNIEDILAYRNDPKWIVYIKKDASGLSLYDYYSQSGYTELRKVPSTAVRNCSLVLQEFQTNEAILTVSPTIVINSVYFMYGNAQLDESAIYYKTNLGDYVFYHDRSIGSGLLFSSARFFEYQKAAVEVAIASYAGQAQTGGANFNDWDLSAYDYRSDNFDPHAPFPISAEPEQTPSPYLWIGIAAGAVVLTAIVAFFIIKTKRKTSSVE